MELHKAGPDYVVDNGDGIILRFSRVRESHEDVTGILRVSLRGYPGDPDSDIFDGRIILTGPQSKNTIIKNCAERAPIPDWYDIINAACVLVRRCLEEGEPITDLAIAQDGDDDDVPYLVAPFLAEGEHTVLFGKGGSGKSTIALALATLYTDGERRLGLEVGGMGRVLYLDYEDSDRSLRRRLWALSSGLFLPETPHIYYKRASASLATMADELGRQIHEQEIDGLIVDSAALACGADPEKAESAILYFNALRSLGVKWSLTVAHQSKHMKEDDPMPFGSVFWWNSPRIIWQARASREEGSNDLHIGLFNHKNNNDELSPALSFNARFSSGSIQLVPEPVRRVEGFRDKVGVNEKIRAFLEDRPGVSMTYNEIASGLSLPPDTIRKTMTRHGATYRRDGEGWRLAFDY